MFCRTFTWKIFQTYHKQIFSSKNNTVIECTSGRKPRLLSSSGRKKRATKKDLVTITIDGAKLVSETEYLYMEDSTIVSTNPLQTIQHGGTRVGVPHLFNIQRADVELL